MYTLIPWESLSHNDPMTGSVLSLHQRPVTPAPEEASVCHLRVSYENLIGFRSDHIWQFAAAFADSGGNSCFHSFGCSIVRWDLWCILPSNPSHHGLLNFPVEPCMEFQPVKPPHSAVSVIWGSILVTSMETLTFHNRIFLQHKDLLGNLMHLILCYSEL